MAELKKKQNGGARPGAGRKKGSTNKLKVSDFYNGEERDLLIQQWKDQTIYSDTPDKQLFLELVHQLFGKATTKIAGDNEEDALRFIEVIRSTTNESNNKPTT